MATVGSVLTSPESGWRRYDDTDSRIQFIGNGTASFVTGANASYYNGAIKYVNSDTQAMGCKIKFNFYGTKLRILSMMLGSSYRYSSNIQIKIDDTIIETFSEYNTTFSTQMLVYEKTGLNLGNHIVELTVLDNYCLNLDAIDIDSTGYLCHPILNQVSDVATMEIGDCIPVRYTSATSGVVGFFSELGMCTANEIPITGSATPDGLLYLIKVAKGLFLADRVIQHSISWEVLNSAKLIKGRVANIDLSPPLTSNTDKGYILTSSSNYTSDYGPFRAFDKAIDTNPSYCYAWMSGTTTGWLAIEFPKAVIVNKYSLAGQYGLLDRSPKNWTIEGWDGTQWVVLDTQTNITGWTNSVYKTFTFNNTTAYKKYRINITLNNGNASYTSIGEMILLNTINNVKIRSLSGGVAHADVNGNLSMTYQAKGAWPTNNEWDKYIVNSDLKGKITKGDDNIWHWDYSKGVPICWCKETPLNNLNHPNTSLAVAVNTNRVWRGSYATSVTNPGVAELGYTTSTLVQTNVGFRPVFEILEADAKASNLYC